MVHLYDLKNDPYENNNIAETNKKLVAEFENLVLEMSKDSFSQYPNEENTEELSSDEIEYELKKIGLCVIIDFNASKHNIFF